MREKDKSRVNLHLAKGDKNIKNLKGVGIQEEITIIVKGKVTRISEDDWDKSTNLEITPGTVKVVVEPISMNDAMKQAEKKA